MKINKEGEEYLDAFPKFRKWINECICCREKGYKPTMPEKITTVDGSLEVYFIKKLFKPLSINEDGLCPQCEKMINKKWINECICCREKGYKPTMLEKITTVDGSIEVYYIKKYFKPLSINEDGLCPQCEKKMNKKSK